MYAYVENNPVIFIDPNGLSWRSVGLGTLSTGVNTAALAFTWNPLVAATLKVAGTAVSFLTAGNAIYENKTGQMSEAEMWTNIGCAAADVVGGVVTSRFLKTGLLISVGSRTAGISNTSIDLVKTASASISDSNSNPITGTIRPATQSSLTLSQGTYK